VLWSGRGQATVYQILHLYDTFGEVTNPHATELLLVANEFKLPKIFAVMTCTVLKLGSDWKAPLDQVSNKVKEYWSLRIAEIRHYEGDSESLDNNHCVNEFICSALYDMIMSRNDTIFRSIPKYD